MQYEMLNIFIDNKLYEDLKEAYDIILVQHLGNKINDEQFMVLYNKLYSNSRGKINPMSSKVLNLICNMIKNGKHVNLELYQENGLLTDEQLDLIKSEGVE